MTLTSYHPSLEVLRILPQSAVRQQKRDPPLPRLQHIGPNHSDFPRGVAELLDLMASCQGSVSDVAALLLVSTAALSKTLTADKAVLAAANGIRAEKVCGVEENGVTRHCRLIALAQGLGLVFIVHESPLPMYDGVSHDVPPFETTRSLRSYTKIGS